MGGCFLFSATFQPLHSTSRYIPYIAYLHDSDMPLLQRSDLLRCVAVSIGILLLILLILVIARVRQTEESFSPMSSLSEIQKTIKDVHKVLPDLAIVNSVQRELQTKQSGGTGSPPTPNKCAVLQKMPVTSRGCFDYTITSADADTANQSATEHAAQYAYTARYDRLSTPRQVLCATLRKRFGIPEGSILTNNSGPIISDPNDPTAWMPYCDVPLQLSPTAETIRGTTNNAIHTNVQAGDQVRICPPQLFASEKTCVYLHPKTELTCGEMNTQVKREFNPTTGSEQQLYQLAKSLPCPSLTDASATAKPPPSPITCNSGSSDKHSTTTKSDRYLYCGDTTPASTPPGDGNCRDDPLAECQLVCQNDRACSYFKLDADSGSCKTYDTFNPLTNIGENSSESTVYGCSGAQPFHSPGLLHVPSSYTSSSTAHTSVASTSSCTPDTPTSRCQIPIRFQYDSLLDTIPCGDCNGSVGGCRQGSCLPLLNPSLTPASATTSSGSIVLPPVQPTACRQKMRNALKFGGLSTTSASDMLHKTTAAQEKTLHAQEQLLDCLCDPTGASCEGVTLPGASSTSAYSDASEKQRAGAEEIAACVARLNMALPSHRVTSDKGMTAITDCVCKQDVTSCEELKTSLG